VRAALILVLALAATPAAAQVSRLPREALDVIPPESRVVDEPGRMRIVEARCRPGGLAGVRQRIVDVAAGEWGVFGFQTVDATQLQTRRLPDGVVADDANPPLAAPRQARPLSRIGRWESDRATYAVVAGYWSATPDGPDVLARQNRQWRDGEGELNWVEPWSAAFISWVMCESGLDTTEVFERDISHRVYVDQAIRAADGEEPQAAYEAHDPGERPLLPGDLLCNSRGRWRYETVADRRPDLGDYAAMHCDVVVRVFDDRVAVIGGNVIQGVTLTLIPLTTEGAAHPRPVGAEDLAGARTLFAHLVLRSDPVPGDALDRTPTVRSLSAP
jgi:hypothetical protein